MERRNSRGGATKKREISRTSSPIHKSTLLSSYSAQLCPTIPLVPLGNENLGDDRKETVEMNVTHEVGGLHVAGDLLQLGLGGAEAERADDGADLSESGIVQSTDNIHLQSEAERHSQGFEDKNLGSSPSWWAATVATYCPSRPGEVPKFLSSKPCE